MPIVQLRICLDPAEYARRRRPYFIRFMDGDFKFHQRKVESFSFAHDCVLEVCFDACETLPAQMPLVCYDPDDSGEQDDSERGFREVYRSKCERIAAVREELDAHFPLCEQEGVGYLDDNDMFAVIRLLPDLCVAVTSMVTIFRWTKGIAMDSMRFETVDKVVCYADRAYPGMRTGGLYFRAEEVNFARLFLGNVLEDL